MLDRLQMRKIHNAEREYQKQLPEFEIYTKLNNVPTFSQKNRPSPEQPNVANPVTGADLNLMRIVSDLF
jgi:hypothetical protein